MLASSYRRAKKRTVFLMTLRPSFDRKSVITCTTE